MLPLQHVVSECAVVQNRPAVGCMFADASAGTARAAACGESTAMKLRLKHMQDMDACSV